MVKKKNSINCCQSEPGLQSDRDCTENNNNKKKKVVCVAGGGIQARRAAECLQRWEIDAGAWLRRQGRLPPQWVRKWRSSVWDTALLLFRTVLGIAVFRSTSCWQGVDCEALTRSISSACTLWPPPPGRITGDQRGQEEILWECGFWSCRKSSAYYQLMY